jgi:hypothetical protein
LLYSVNALVESGELFIKLLNSAGLGRRHVQFSLLLFVGHYNRTDEEDCCAYNEDYCDEHKDCGGQPNPFD